MCKKSIRLKLGLYLDPHVVFRYRIRSTLLLSLKTFYCKRTGTTQKQSCDQWVNFNLYQLLVSTLLSYNLIQMFPIFFLRQTGFKHQDKRFLMKKRKAPTHDQVCTPVRHPGSTYTSHSSHI